MKFTFHSFLNSWKLWCRSFCTHNRQWWIAE